MGLAKVGGVEGAGMRDAKARCSGARQVVGEELIGLRSSPSVVIIWHATNCFLTLTFIQLAHDVTLGYSPIDRLDALPGERGPTR